jgi:putative Mn2+ efflux pump MntP
MARLLLLGLLAGIDNVQVAAAISAAPLARRRRLLLATSFALCEIASPLLGVLLAHLLRTKFGVVLDGVGPLVVVACGIAIVWLALRDDDDAKQLLASRWTLIGLPLSLSVDNLLIGVSAVSLGYPPALAALVIGATSATMCVIGVVAGERMARLIPARAELVSGCALIVIAASMWIRSS